MTFDTFALDERLLAGVRHAGYTSPTPIQQQAIGPVMGGRDVLGLAQTDTGKTAAFVLPVLHRLLAENAPKRGPVRALVLAPTRELAVQIQDDFVNLGRQTGIRCAAVFGGVGQNPQVKALRQASVVVACPGRLLDLMNQGLADLSQVDTLVLDEADRMLDMGFAPDIKRILARLTTRRQTLLFSATMPHEIRAMADDLMHNPVRVQVANTTPSGTISHCLYPVAGHCKQGLLEALLQTSDHESVIVFTRTKHRAKSLARKLEQRGWSATCLQGNQSQNRRQEAMTGFKSGKYTVLVATDIAARGIDCASVTHVINFDVPDTAEAYTHRIGRTGRALRSGQALTLATPEDNGQIRAIERVLGKSIKRERLDGFDYDVPDTRPGRQDELDRRDDRRPQGRGRPAKAAKPKGNGGSGSNRQQPAGDAPKPRRRQSRRPSRPAA